MPKRRKKEKTLKQLLTIAGIIFLCVVAAAFFVLDITKILPFDDVLIYVGVKDKPAEHSDVEVDFVDVGQGDCTIVMSQGKTMVIDSGDKDKLNTVVNYISKLGIKTIDYLIVTHPHADHIGEMADILNNFKVNKFVMPKVQNSVVPTTSLYENMLLAVKKQGLKITKAVDCEFTLGKCTVKLFTPKNDYTNLNNYSTLVKVINGKNSFLITGDCEKQEEQDIMSQGFDLTANVLKAGHHGSSTSSSTEFLEKIMPKYAVISCGYKNRYGHPADDTVVRLRKFAPNVYQTVKNGTIKFISDGKGITVKTEKSG